MKELITNFKSVLMNLGQKAKMSIKPSQNVERFPKNYIYVKGKQLKWKEKIKNLPNSK